MPRVGYYPGQPIPRPPRKGAVPPPEEYTFDVLANWIENVFKDIDFGKLPAAVKNAVIEDIKTQFKLSATPKKAGYQSYDPQRALEFGDIDDTPGVQLQVSINPGDWSKDPEGQFKSTIEQWVKSTFDWKDFRNYIEQKYFWEPVLAGRDNLAPEGQSPFFRPAEEYAKHTLGITPTTEPNPYQMQGLRVMKPGDTEVNMVRETSPGTYDIVKEKIPTDVYSKVGQSFLKFTVGVEATSSRNRDYNELRLSALDAVATEVENFRNNVTGLSVDEIAAIEDFLAGTKAVQRISNFTKKEGIFGVQENLGKIVVGGEKAGLTIQNSMKTLQKVASDALNDIDTVIPANLNPIQKQNYNLVMSSFRRKVEDIHNLAVEAQSSGSVGILSAGVLKGRLDTLASSITQPGAIKGIQHDLLNKTTGRYLMQGGSMFTPNSGDTLRDVFTKTASHTNSQVDQYSGIENVRRLLMAANPMYEKNDFADFLSNIEKGRLFKVYVWQGKIRPYLDGLYPSQAVKATLQRSHYLGLVYDPDFAGSSTKAFTARNTFSVDISGVGRVKVAGGKHFKGAVTLHGILSDHDAANKTLGRLNAVLDKNTGALVGFNDSGNSMIRFLNGDISVVKGLKVGEKEFTDLVENNEKFLRWLKENQQRLGLSFNGNYLENTAENGRILTELMQGLGKRIRSTDYINITWDRVGHLQKLSSLANQIQTEVFKRIGKYVAPLFQVKDAISTAVARAIRTALLALLAGSTSGAGSVLAPIIDKVITPVVKFVTNLVINKTEAFLKAIFKGELSTFFKDLDKLVTTGVKMILYITAFPFFIIMIISFMFFGSSLITFPPIDTTRSSTGYQMAGMPRADCRHTGESCSDSSICCSLQCVSGECVGDELPVVVPPGSGSAPPRGRFGDGTNCPGRNPFPGLLGYSCTHSSTEGISDVYQCEGQPVVAPFDGCAFPEMDPTGGVSVYLYPTDPSGDWNDEITSPCPSLYFTHMMDTTITGRPSPEGCIPVAAGTTLGHSDCSGSCHTLGTHPHTHFAGSQTGNFQNSHDVAGVSVVDLISRWSSGALACFTDWRAMGEIWNEACRP